MLVVLYDCADGVMLPAKGEAVVPHVIAGKSLDKMQSKHRWYAGQKTKEDSCFLFYSYSVNIALLTKMKHGTTQQKSVSQ